MKAAIYKSFVPPEVPENLSELSLTDPLLR